MSRCRGWRYLPPDDPEHPLNHEPGRCRVCWRICRQRLDDGAPRCRDCELALLMHPSTPIRASLAADEQTRLQALYQLAEDREMSVSMIAEETLARLGHDAHAHGPAVDSGVVATSDPVDDLFTGMWVDDGSVTAVAAPTPTLIIGGDWLDDAAPTNDSKDS